MNPSASGGTVVPLPPKAPVKVTMDRGGAQASRQQIVAPTNDLLGGETQAVKKEDTAQLTDFFDSVAISTPTNGTTASVNSNPNPFNSFAPALNNFSPTPTIAQLPTNTLTSTNQQVQHQGQVSQSGMPPVASFPYSQVHAPQMVNQNNTGIQGQGPKGVYSNIQPPQPVAYYTQPQHVAPAYYAHQVPTAPGPPPQALQQSPSSNISQFDPFAKR